MLNYSSASKRLIMLITILLTTSCATPRIIDNINDKNMPAFKVGEKVKIYTRNNVTVEFVIYKIDSTFIYGESDSPKIRKDEIKKVELPESKMQKFSRHYLVGGIILTLLSMMFAP